MASGLSAHTLRVMEMCFTHSCIVTEWAAEEKMDMDSLIGAK